MKLTVTVECDSLSDMAYALHQANSEFNSIRAASCTRQNNAVEVRDLKIAGRKIGTLKLDVGL